MPLGPPDLQVKSVRLGQLEQLVQLEFKELSEQLVRRVYQVPAARPVLEDLRESLVCQDLQEVQELQARRDHPAPQEQVDQAAQPVLSDQQESQVLQVQ